MEPDTGTTDTAASQAIRPFRIEIAQSTVDDLRDRVRRTRWPQQPEGTGWARGVPVAYLRELAGHWSETFDWRVQEDRLNEVPQFVTTIEGQDIHFLHVRSAESDAVPLILTHGWPSTPFEFLDVIGPLTDPRAHGLDPADAFHVVVPSLPGYGFSTPTVDPGWGNLFRVAQAWAELMRRLGYEHYAVHGTDVGSGVALLLGMVDGDRVMGTHITGTEPAMPFGPPLDETAHTGQDRIRAERFNQHQRDELGYLHLQATRPQTLAYSLTDSPVAQLAWIAEKFREWTDPERELPDEAIDREALLTCVSIAWFTGAGGSSAHSTYEGMQVYREMADQSDDSGSEQPPGPPTGVAVFAADNMIKSVFDPADRITHWSEFDTGGHFPGLETPSLLVGDLAAFFRGLRPVPASG
ncbi:epoxide hydrolase family protein [Ornithinimicrobium murale]|uniref:epoxide hydrolase family protein n=1 Tax=Ornithinimicrobium murale TaxID=1050153 RepID=UPI000E0DC850|nr:epoxide hydrolase family protein [Ornithinimicrobium murale]